MENERCSYTVSCETVGRKRDFCRSSARCWVTHWDTWGPVPPWTSVPLSVRKWRSSCQVRPKHRTVLPFAVSSCCRCQMLLEKRQSACNRSQESNVPWRVLDQLMMYISLCINWCHLGCRTKLGTVRKCLFSAQLLFRADVCPVHRRILWKNARYHWVQQWP